MQRCATVRGWSQSGAGRCGWLGRGYGMSLDEGRRREVVWAALCLKKSERWWGSMGARTGIGVTPEAAVIAVTSPDSSG